MTVMNLSLTGAPSTSKVNWNAINWPQITKEVRRLQMRIAKAVREKRYGKVKALQWLLTHSYSAKLLAIKRVTSNTGAYTPGVDGVLWKTSSQRMKAVESLQRRGYKPQPLRRLYIPKKNGKQRPLSIPSIGCRAMQALHLLALEPVAEMKADKHAYGFRPKRSTADAIGQCFNALSRKVSHPWILEGDIRSCFDSICGSWLKENIPMDKTLLTKWLTAGYINAIAYADDFIVTAASREVLEQKVMPTVISFLKERGLELSLQKTQITHIDTGFDFLGFNIRKYRGTLLIRPSKENIKAFLSRIRGVTKSQPTIKTEELIQQLNPKIRGWSNYYRHVCSKKAFSYVDYFILKSVMKWVKRRHPEKNAEWMYNKYFRSQDFRNWVFSTVVKDKKGRKTFLDLLRAAQTPIRRHVKIKGDATPYDPQYTEYFLKRDRRKNNFSSEDRKRKSSPLSEISRISGPCNGL